VKCDEGAISTGEEWKEKTVSNYSLIAHEDRRCIDSSHSISRNIAEEYSRRSIKDMS